jgi:hypothetical protein
VNAAFLLVTTAWLAGADPAVAPAAPAAKPAAPVVVTPAPVVAAPADSCSSCGSPATCDSCEPKHHHTFKGLFSGCHKKSCETCGTCAPAPAPAPCCAPAPAPAPCCAPAPAPKPCCAAPAPAPACDSCGKTHECLFKGLFAHHHKADCGCATPECASCGSAPVAVPGVIVPSAEPIPAPKETPAKKMPVAPPAKSVQILNQDSAPIPVSAPAVEGTPAIVPNVPANNDRREPF